MRAEIAGLLRRASRREIGRARADDAANRADAASPPGCCRAARRSGRARSTCSSKQIDHTVGQHDPDVDVGIGLEELRDDRQDVQAAEDDRRGDDQVAFRRAVFADAARSASSTSSSMRLQAAT